MDVHTIKPLLLAKIMSEKGPMTYLCYQGQPVVRPYVSWYIRADNKNVLVDTAIEAEDYRNLHPGFGKMPYEPLQSFEAALGAVGCTPENIDIIIQTHLHMDHIHNTPKCKNAAIYVQEAELQFALDPHPIQEIMYPKEIIQKIDFEVINGDRTILPGISVMLTPGHTPGGQSVVVDTRKGKVVISGLCSIMENFFPPEDVKTSVSPFATYPVIAPGIHTDVFGAYDSLIKIKEKADIIIPLHDPDMAVMEDIPWG